MPIYEYRCEKCDAVLEMIQPMNAKTPKRCGDRCIAEGKPGDGKLSKLLSVSAVHSGSGTQASPPPCGGCGMEGNSCPLGY